MTYGQHQGDDVRIDGLNKVTYGQHQGDDVRIDGLNKVTYGQHQGDEAQIVNYTKRNGFAWFVAWLFYNY